MYPGNRFNFQYGLVLCLYLGLHWHVCVHYRHMYSTRSCTSCSYATSW